MTLLFRLGNSETFIQNVNRKLMIYKLCKSHVSETSQETFFAQMYKTFIELSLTGKACTEGISFDNKCH